MNEVRHSIKFLKTTVRAIITTVKFHNPPHKLCLHSCSSKKKKNEVFSKITAYKEQYTSWEQRYEIQGGNKLQAFNFSFTGQATVYNRC